MHQLVLPKISERIRGFTPPKGGVFYVFDYDEVFRVELGSVPKVEILDKDPLDFELECGEFYGVSEKPPVLSSPNHKLTYNFDTKANEVEVSVASTSATELVKFPTLSGDWFVATIEENGQYLLMAEPYCLKVFSLTASGST